jgi:hypothetical protein
MHAGRSRIDFAPADNTEENLKSIEPNVKGIFQRGAPWPFAGRVAMHRNRRLSIES